MRINTNIMAFNAYRNLNTTNDRLASSLEKLSSGFRINRAADDASGLVISQNLDKQVSGLKVATQNAQDGISVVQTAEGALTQVNSMLEPHPRPDRASRQHRVVRLDRAQRGAERDRAAPRRNRPHRQHDVVRQPEPARRQLRCARGQADGSTATGLELGVSPSRARPPTCSSA